MNILGISAFYHDSAAAIIREGEIIAAAQEERFTRKKHDAGFPANAVKFCLDFANISVDELDAVVFYDKPLLKFERLMETYYAFAPRGFISFLKAMPVWMKEKLFLKKLIRDELAKIQPYNKKKLQLLFPEHHLSHAASAFFPSSFEQAAIVTIDGVGEWATTSVCSGQGNKITVLKELHFPHSPGLLYSAFTYYCGFKVNSGEYKLMGLAPYGNPQAAQTKEFIEIIRNRLCKIFDDGSVLLNQEYFNYATGLKMTNDDKWKKLFGFAARKPTEALQQHHCNMALAIQRVMEEIVLKICREAKRLTNCDNLCMAGGVALNCVANGKVQNEKVFDNIYIQPAAGDAGGALGAALAAHYIYFEKERIINYDYDAMKGAYLGPTVNKADINKLQQKYSCVFDSADNWAALTGFIAQKLAEGNVIGWVQDRMEFGPRALGNRSILADARNPEMQKKLNLKIKYREGFRPFAPSVIAEDMSDYFEMNDASPYMLFVHTVKKERQKPVPENYHSFSLQEKLYFQRSDLPAITHIDYSARIQTVHEQTNEKFYTLIRSFKELTGTGVLVNTSFNIRGEPIVCTAEDAYRCFMKTEMDYLVIDNCFFDKKLQPVWREQGALENKFEAD